MVHIDTLPLGAYQTNCYLVWADASTTCAVIDPGYYPEQILAYLEKKALKPDAILLTHGHFDHVGGAEALVKATGCSLWMQERDNMQASLPSLGQLFPLTGRPCKVNFFEQGQTVTAGGVTFTVLETPGHTHGSVCLAAEDVLFTGDTLFAGSVGRTDFPGSDTAAMLRSLAFLKALPRDYRIYPGHGSSTTLEHEKRCNPYMR